MDRVERQICIPAAEGYTDDDEVMNMIKIVSEALFRDGGTNISKHKVASRSPADLVRDMSGHVELTLTPRARHLRVRWIRLILLNNRTTYPSTVHIEVIAFHVSKELLSGICLDK